MEEHLPAFDVAPTAPLMLEVPTNTITYAVRKVVPMKAKRRVETPRMTDELKKLI